MEAKAPFHDLSLVNLWIINCNPHLIKHNISHECKIRNQKCTFNWSHGKLFTTDAEHIALAPRVDLSPERLSIDHAKYNAPSIGKADVNIKETDPLEILDHVKIVNTFESPRSTIRGVLRDSKENNLRFKKEELKKVEQRLKMAFIEFYQKLRLLKNFR